MTRAAATRRAYRSDWTAFTTWCAAARVTPRPAAPSAVARAVEGHRTYVAEQTLAVDVQITVGPELSIHVTKTPCPSSPNP